MLPELSEVLLHAIKGMMVSDPNVRMWLDQIMHLSPMRVLEKLKADEGRESVKRVSAALVDESDELLRELLGE
jgi:hypothetical protein